MRLLDCVASALLIATVVGAPAAASAEDDVVLVPTSGGVGAEMPDIAARITDAVARVATRAGLVPKPTHASRDDVFAVAGCTTDSDPCHQAVLRTLSAEKLILIHVVPGAGEFTAEVEIAVATRGQPPSNLTLKLSGQTADALIAELEAGAPPVFANAGSTLPGGRDPGVPTENTTIEGGLNQGEGGELPGPAGPPTQGPPETATTEPRALPQTGAAVSNEDSGGGYDFSRVSGTSWAVGGAGAGLVLTSFVFYGLASSKQGEVNRARANTGADIDLIRDLEGSGQNRTNIANTTFLLGVVGLGVGGYLIYRDAKVPEGEASGAAAFPTLIGDGVGIGFAVTR